MVKQLTEKEKQKIRRKKAHQMKRIEEGARIRKIKQSREWVTIRGLLGYTWAWFYALLGGREAGKSYSVTEFFVRQWKFYGIPFTWLRLNEASTKKLLNNNAEKLVDADIYRKYHLNLKVKGTDVYDGDKRMCSVLALSTFANDKGTALFDKDFIEQICPGGKKMYYHIALDEFQREKTQRSQGDICYQFVNQMENLVRSTKKRMRIFLIGNTLEECADILTMFNFIPEEFGRYKIKKKRCVIDYMEPTDAYKARRAGSVGDILMGDQSNFTNKIDFDKSLVTKQRLIKPSYIILFDKRTKFTVWDGGIVAKFNGERCKQTIAMRPYQDCLYNQTLRDQVIQLFDARGFYYHDLITNKRFQKEISIIKPRKQ